MKFKNDSQRRAVFANMNKFAAGPYSYSDRMNMAGFSTNPTQSISDNMNANYGGFAKKPEDNKVYRHPLRAASFYRS